MWTRQELKERGRAAFTRNYWSAVLVSFILLLIGGTFTNQYNATKEMRRNSSGSRYNNSFDGYYGNFEDDYDKGEIDIIPNPFIGSMEGTASRIFTSIFTMMLVVVTIIMLVFRIFLGNNLFVGGQRFYLENREYRARAGSLTYALKGNRYSNVMITMLCMDVFVFLWSLLFVVPGIIKSYEYRMVPYLLAENPHLDRRRAFALSRQMMDGQKLEAFILDISFLGWIILTVFTCNILGVFYVAPYMDATCAELYAVLRTEGFRTGMLNSVELPGFGTA